MSWYLSTTVPRPGAPLPWLTKDSRVEFWNEGWASKRPWTRFRLDQRFFAALDSGNAPSNLPFGCLDYTHRVLKDLFGRCFPADVTFCNNPCGHGGSHRLARRTQDEHVFSTNGHSRTKYPLPRIRPGEQCQC